MRSALDEKTLRSLINGISEVRRFFKSQEALKHQKSRITLDPLKRVDMMALDDFDGWKDFEKQLDVTYLI
ncbi:hypothetical protein J6590_071280 [Homalodisca vitripennis]|nr:hypothetical protein J6590_071280 [Homalodisca vitripennis]